MVGVLGIGVACAAPRVNLQDGLVNVGVGNVTIAKDVNVDVAAQVIAAVCGTDVTAAVLGSVDQTGETQTFYSLPGGPLTVAQNAGTSPGTAEERPGQQPVSTPTVGRLHPPWVQAAN